MSNFHVLCSMNYPQYCNLPLEDKYELRQNGGNKLKGFLMYDFNGADNYLSQTLKEYCNEKKVHLYDLSNESGMGIKICKICRYILASDFGVACLSPENYNVFLEIGMFMGLEKPLIFIYNKDKLQHKAPEKLPFDISPFMGIEYSTPENLRTKLKKEMPGFLHKCAKDNVERIDRLFSSGGYDDAIRILRGIGKNYGIVGYKQPTWSAQALNLLCELDLLGYGFFPTLEDHNIYYLTNKGRNFIEKKLKAEKLLPIIFQNIQVLWYWNGQKSKEAKKVEYKMDAFLEEYNVSWETCHNELRGILIANGMEDKDTISMLNELAGKMAFDKIISDIVTPWLEKLNIKEEALR